MPNPASFPRPSTRARSFVLAGLPFVLALGLVGSPVAQTGPGPEKPHGRHPAMRQLGPVSPEILRDSIGVTGAKLDQYARQYRSHMAATKPARDSLRIAMRSIHEAYKSGDRTTAQNRRQAVRQEAESLMKRDREFEAGLTKILSQDQQKRYTGWKENQIELARQWRHHRHWDHGAGESKGRAGRDSAATFSDSARS
jgi:hypothetical protein